MNEMVSRKEGVAIRCEGLSKRFGEVEALMDLNLEIPAGSVFGFLGRNGAGKNTAIRLLTGLAHPTAGKAWIAGVETTNGDSGARERFGYLPQDPAFYSWMTSFEYLDYVLSLFRKPYKDRKHRIEEVLEQVGLRKAVKRRIGGFSGGMRQRLGIAQALVHNPPVLLLDEPTSSLDPAGRYELLDLIDSLRGERTVFLSSHILADIERVCDTIGVIHEGRLLFVSDRKELMERYETNIVFLEFDVGAAAKLAGFADFLSGLPWVVNVYREENSIRIAVKDVSKAKSDLIPLIAEKGLLLNRYEWVRPTLEEIFLQVSA
ncbi:MAG: ABC transporter ATP-binding protein [Anaerolineaceae bacterium]|nr:ABC transporter ATP-binding protein [Anaerolineaceae bacterium]